MTSSLDDRNFRLSTQLRPTRYAARLDLDLEGRRFAGAMELGLVLEAPSSEVVLHAIDLELSEALLRVGDGYRKATSIERFAASETVRIRFAEPIPAGPASLSLQWSGAFCTGLRGLYWAGGMAVTQFEAADARRVFPCFDEPAFKAHWALTLSVPADAEALANGAELSRTLEGNRKVIRFAETEILSSYLVALAAGRFVSSPPGHTRGVEVRTWSPPEKAHLSAFGQDVAMNVLPRLEDYFAAPYAFGKLDQLGVPEFEAGAMENAGLVTYREVALLLDPATASLAVQKRVAEVVTHELAHQWFGNWVTMKWWDDLWLNEAFATWMAYKIVDPWRPEWRLWLDFDQGKSTALNLDALSSTHPVRSEVRNAAEATEAFDAITYEKGGAVLRMIEAFLGEVPFREGIRAYMRSHGRSNAVADDLWNALGEASKQPVTALANAWIRQSGFPLVHAQSLFSRLTLRQQRFFSEPGQTDDSLWPVPVVLRYANARGERFEQRVLLSQREQTFELEHLAPDENPLWLVVNGGNTGFFRTTYSPALLKRLQANLAALEPAERVSLVGDQWALLRAGAASIGGVLDLLTAFEGEQDPAVLDEVIGRLAGIEGRWCADADVARVRTLIAGMFSKSFAACGWDGAKDERDLSRLRRAALVRAMGVVAREPAVVAEAARRFERLLAGEPSVVEANLQDPMVSMAARAGDAPRYEALLKAFQAEKDPAFRRRYLLALAAFEAPALWGRTLELLFTDTVPMQDFASLVAALMGNRAARSTVWSTLQRRWDDVLAKAGGAPMMFRRVVEALGAMCERAELESVRAFLEAHPYEAAKQAAAQTLERMAQDVALRERSQAEITAWLDARKG